MTTTKRKGHFSLYDFRSLARSRHERKVKSKNSTMITRASGAPSNGRVAASYLSVPSKKLTTRDAGNVPGFFADAGVVASPGAGSAPAKPPEVMTWESGFGPHTCPALNTP